MVLGVKNLPANTGDIRDAGSTLGFREDLPRGGYGNPLQYSCLENPIDRGAWRAGNNAPTGASETIQFRPRKDFYPAPNFPLIDPEGKKKDLDNCIQIHLPKPFQT